MLRSLCGAMLIHTVRVALAEDGGKVPYVLNVGMSGLRFVYVYTDCIANCQVPLSAVFECSFFSDTSTQYSCHWIFIFKCPPLVSISCSKGL